MQDEKDEKSKNNNKILTREEWLKTVETGPYDLACSYCHMPSKATCPCAYERYVEEKELAAELAKNIDEYEKVPPLENKTNHRDRLLKQYETRMNEEKKRMAVAENYLLIATKAYRAAKTKYDALKNKMEELDRINKQLQELEEDDDNDDNDDDDDDGDDNIDEEREEKLVNKLNQQMEEAEEREKLLSYELWMLTRVPNYQKCSVCGHKHRNSCQCAYARYKLEYEQGHPNPPPLNARKASQPMTFDLWRRFVNKGPVACVTCRKCGGSYAGSCPCAYQRYVLGNPFYYNDKDDAEFY